MYQMTDIRAAGYVGDVAVCMQFWRQACAGQSEVIIIILCDQIVDGDGGVKHGPSENKRLA